MNPDGRQYQTMNRKIYIKNTAPIFQSPNLVIYKPDENGIMVSEWSGFLTAAFAKEGCTAILRCLQEFPAAKLLNCNLNVTGHYAGAIDWLGKVWFSELNNIGLKYCAWVYSPEFYTQIGTDEAISYTEKIAIKTFISFEDAYLWLQSV